MIGKTLAHYEVTALLGKGGMGEVYRARDTKLGRDVALKLLPPELSGDPDRLARFQREARTLASLQHPNIASIFGFEEVEGIRFLSMELVEGDDLAQRLSRGRISIEDAIDIARQIALGLESAHEKSIVHRDLKPANVKIGAGGQVKILDFGLAKAYASDVSDSSALEHSPTITAAMTQAGMLLGTAAYMSPEQAKGRTVDKRTDIWAFGVVLFELLTGRQLFTGDSVAEVLASVLKIEPDLDRLPTDTPVALRTLLERCLDKDPQSRLRDIGEARVALEQLSRGEPVSAVRVVDGPRGSRRSVIAPVLLVLAAVLVSVTMTRLLVKPPPPRLVALSVMLPQDTQLDAGVDNNMLALGPDGRSLAYVARQEGVSRLFLRRLDRPEISRIPETEDAHNPFFSPDSEWIGFFAGHRMYKVSVRGGAPVEVVEAGADRGGIWLEDGSILYAPTYASALYRVDSRGGEPEPVTTLNDATGERSHRWPCALPGGEWVVFTVGAVDSPGDYEDASIDAVSLRTGERRSLARGSCARYAPGGWLIIARGGSLYAMSIDPGNPRGGATAVPVLDGVLGARTSGIAFFDVAGDGTLALIPGEEEHALSRLVWIDRSGTETPVPGDPRAYKNFEISPDGTSALVEIGPGGGEGDVYLLDLERGGVNQMTFGGHDDSPRWLPDGDHFVWSRSSEGRGQVIEVRSIAGGDSTRTLTTGSLPLIITEVTPGGKSVLFSVHGSVDSDILEVPIEGGEVRTLIQEPGSQAAARISPDGRWIAYTSNETGRSEICVKALGRASARTQISTNGGRMPEWSPDGLTLYYAEGRAVVGTRLVIRGDTVFTDATEKVFDLPYLGSDTSVRDFDLDPSGEKFLVRVPSGAASEYREIALRLGWAASLRARQRSDD